MDVRPITSIAASVPANFLQISISFPGGLEPIRLLTSSRPLRQSAGFVRRLR
jgi:hypothetical protein